MRLSVKRAALISVLLLGACTVGPDYAEPQLAVPANYLEAPAGSDIPRLRGVGLRAAWKRHMA